MGEFLPYGHQWIDDNDVEAVVRVLKSDFLTQGPLVQRFEEAILETCGAKHCVAVANGTAALHIAVAALELDSGVEGITSPITFVASANCLVYNGITPKFADIDPRTYNIDPQAIQERITERTRVIIPVHFAGQPADVKQIAQGARKRGITIIEDAAHAIGSIDENGSRIGDCRNSDMTAFSFHPVKNVTTGEGGAITTNDDALFRKLQLLRNHGITRDPVLLSQNPGPWYYEMQEIGYNYRLTDLQAALGVAQLSHLDAFKKRRREIVARYNQAFSNLPHLTVPFERTGNDSCFHLYVVQIDFDAMKTSRTQIMELLRKQGVGTQVHYIPVHTQPFYRKRFGYRDGDFPVAERYYGRALSLPLFPKMSDGDVGRVIDAVRSIVEG